MSFACSLSAQLKSNSCHVLNWTKWSSKRILWKIFSVLNDYLVNRKDVLFESARTSSIGSVIILKLTSSHLNFKNAEIGITLSAVLTVGEIKPQSKLNKHFEGSCELLRYIIHCITVLYTVVQFCTLLYSFVHHCTVFYGFVQCWTVLSIVVQCCKLLYTFD